MQQESCASICKAIEMNTPRQIFNKAAAFYVHKVVKNMKPEPIFENIRFPNHRRACQMLSSKNKAYTKRRKRGLIYWFPQLYNNIPTNLSSWMWKIQNLNQEVPNCGHWCRLTKCNKLRLTWTRTMTFPLTWLCYTTMTMTHLGLPIKHWLWQHEQLNCLLLLLWTSSVLNPKGKGGVIYDIQVSLIRTCWLLSIYNYLE